MNWDAIGATAEAVGAAGVVATLAYLAFQIRQNTSSVRAASASSFTGAQSDFQSLVLTNADLGDLYINGLQNPDSLSEAEMFKFNLLIENFILHFQQAEELESAGALSRDLAHVRDAQLDWMVSQPGFRAHYAAWGYT
jgi:hypothetical protein